MGTVTATGFHFLPRNGITQEAVRLLNGNVNRTIPVARVPGPGPGISMELTHSSEDDPLVGPLGIRWRHSYETKLKLVSSTLVTMISGDGQHIDLAADSSGNWKIDGATSLYEKIELEHVSGGIWTLKSLPDRTTWTFDANPLVGFPDTAGRLISIADRHGNTTSLVYDSGYLAYVEDAFGRKLEFSYNGQGLVQSLTDPNNNTTVLTYDPRGHLKTVSGPEGCTVTFEVDYTGQITKQVDARGHHTSYVFGGSSLLSVAYADGSFLSYRYLQDADRPTEMLALHAWQFNPLDATIVTNGEGAAYEFRFDPKGNLFRSISPSGHVKKYMWSGKQRFLYSSEGFLTLRPAYDETYPAGIDCQWNRLTRRTVNEDGDTTFSLDGTGLGSTVGYTAEGQVAWMHPGQVHQGIQGEWPQAYGSEGVLLCAFNSDHSDAYDAPVYMHSDPLVAVGNGDSLGASPFERVNANGTNVIDPRAPVRSKDSPQKGVGFWKQQGADATGCSFQCQLNLTQERAFNLSVYSHSADEGLDAAPLIRYARRFGRDVELEVQDREGVQVYRIHNNAPGVWVTFPVQGGPTDPIVIRVRSTGLTKRAMISALAFDPHEDRRTFFEYEDGQLTRMSNSLGHFSEYTYNPDGTMQSMRDANGNVTAYQYGDSYKNLTDIVAAQPGVVTSMTYDAIGNVLSVTDAKLRTTSMTYDGKSRLLSTTDPSNRVSTLTYDGNGNVLEAVDVAGRSTQFVYDVLNRLSRVTNSLGQHLSLAYDKLGRIQKVTDHRKLVTRYRYNVEGQIESVEGPDGQSVSYSYDTLGQIVAVTSPNGNQEAQELLNLVGAANLFRNPSLEKEDPVFSNAADHWRLSTDVNARSTRSSAQSAEGDFSLALPTNGATWRQDKLDLPKGAKCMAIAKVKGANANFSGGTLSLTATMRSFLAAEVSQTQSTSLADGYLDWKDSEALRFQLPGDAQTSPSNPVFEGFDIGISGTNGSEGWADDLRLYMLSTAFQHDKAGRMKSVHQPDGTKVALIRDRLGRVIAAEDARGLRTLLSYDPLDRVVQLIKPDGEVMQFTYDGMGALLTFVDGKMQTTAFVYDVMNRLERIEYGDSSDESFSYDSVGNLVSYSDNSAQARLFEYDNLDRLSRIEYADSTALEFTYDLAGNLSSVIERNGDTLVYTYDDLDRLTSSQRTAEPGNGTPSWNHSYAYDPNGNRISLGAGGEGSFWEAGGREGRYAQEGYGQGRYGQLRYGQARYGQARYSGGYNSLDQPLGYRTAEGTQVEFEYDIEGRRNRSIYVNGTASDVDYDIMGRPMSIRTSRTVSATELWKTDYSYDANSNRVAQVTGQNTLEYQVDVSGRLTGETANRFCPVGVDGFGSSSLQELNLAGSGVRLNQLSDAFAGNQFDCDRWRFGYNCAWRPGNGTRRDSDSLRGSSFLQDDGLHFAYPKGYSNRQSVGESYEALNEHLGGTGEPVGVFAEHRSMFVGDFDVSVEMDFFAAYGNDTARAGLFLSESPSEKPVIIPYIMLHRSSNGYLYAAAGYTGGARATTEQSHRLRVVRAGNVVTLYVWESGAWVSDPGWSTTFAGSTPLYLSLFSEASYNLCSSFRNFVVAGQTYALQGNLTTPVYDAGREVTWSNLAWSQDQPVGTSIKMQVATANSEKGPWSFVGPDGTEGTFFTAAAGASLASGMTGRYARVKAVLTGDGTVTPTLEELRLDFVGEVSSRSARYVYDEAGNLTHRVASLGGSVTEETRVYNNLNELVSNVIDDGASTQSWTFSYDDNGNLVQRSNGTETHVYSWDEDNRLVAVEVNGSNLVTYQYDSSSRLLQRVEGGTTTNYIWDGWDLIREEKSGAVTETTDYLCPAGEVLAFKRDGDWYYLHGDGLSSTQLMTDASGAVVGRYVYGAWGDELVASESVPGVFENRFVGGLGCRRDSATGLVYMRHRWYDVQLQRFISRDPIGFEGGLNLYEYARSRPSSLIDSFGLEPRSATICTGVGYRSGLWWSGVPEHDPEGEGLPKNTTLITGATSKQVINALESSSIFVYEGHHFGGGRILLADGEFLFSDLLARAKRLPTYVLLNACNSSSALPANGKYPTTVFVGLNNTIDNGPAAYWGGASVTTLQGRDPVVTLRNSKPSFIPSLTVVASPPFKI